MAKVRQNNMADQHLVVRSIEVLDGGGIGGAGGKTIERRLDQVEQSITLLNSQTDYYSQIAEDNIITPTEKQTLKKESYAINAEYTSILNRADTAGVTHSAEADAYKQCYKNLTDMWGELGIFDNMEEETRIPQRNAFNTVYQEYYEARDALNNRITIGYIGEEHGMQDIGATPALMLTYSNELIPYGNAVKTEDMIEYDPPSIRINSVITNGVYSDPYDGIIEIYRNGELAHKTGIVKNYPYVIPEGTTSLRFVLRNVTDNLIYDDEEVAVLTPDNGIQVILDNTYQTIKNGTVSQAESEYHPDFTTKVRAFNGITELQRVDFVIPTVTGFNFTLDSETKTLHYTPTDELMTEGEFSVAVDIRSQKAAVLGMFNGTTAAVLGVPGAKFVIGDKYQVIKPATVHWRNYNSLGLVQLETQVNQNLNDAILANKYMGPINSTANIPGSAEIGEYFFYSGQNVPSTAPYTWAQGQLYMWTGSRWLNDNNYTHKMTAMPDAVAVLNSMPNEAFYTQFIKDLVALNATIVNLFSQKITLKPISPTEAAFIQGLRPDNTLGFKLDSNGHAELNDALVRGTIYATNGEFSGELKGAKGTFSGELQAATGTFSGNFTAKDGLFEGSIKSTNAHLSGTSTFDGDIYSGPLELSSRTSEGATYSSTFKRTEYTARGQGYTPELYTLLKSFNLISSESNVGVYGYPGSFTSKKINGTQPRSYSYLSCSWTSDRPFGSEVVTNTSTMNLYDANMNLLATYTSDATVSFKISIAGSKTFKLKDLPPSASAEKGVVYTTGDGILRISV